MSNRLVLTRRLAAFLGEMAGVDFTQRCGRGYLGVENAKDTFCDAVPLYDEDVNKE